MKDPWKCECCGTVTAEAALLVAPNPFDADRKIYGCPQCKQVDMLVRACDVPGCGRDGTCGFPTSGGYMVTCGEHMRQYDKGQ